MLAAQDVPLGIQDLFQVIMFGEVVLHRTPAIARYLHVLFLPSVQRIPHHAHTPVFARLLDIGERRDGGYIVERRRNVVKDANLVQSSFVRARCRERHRGAKERGLRSR